MKENSKDTVYTVFTVIIVLLVLGGGIFKTAPLFRQYAELKKQVAERDARIHEIERRTSEINDQERRFNTDAECVQAEARKSHHYHPREYVIIFENEESRK